MHYMESESSLDQTVSRFLDAWLGVRQLIQAANFNRFQKAGLSATQFMILNTLPTDDVGMPLSQLARRLNLGSATVTKTVDSLEARALVIRTQGASDRRQVLLSLTMEGRTFQNAASTEFHTHMARLFEQIPTDRREGLVLGLEALLTAGGADTDARGEAQERRNSQQSRRQ